MCVRMSNPWNSFVSYPEHSAAECCHLAKYCRHIARLRLNKLGSGLSSTHSVTDHIQSLNNMCLHIQCQCMVASLGFLDFLCFYMNAMENFEIDNWLRLTIDVDTFLLVCYPNILNHSLVGFWFWKPIATFQNRVKFAGKNEKKRKKSCNCNNRFMVYIFIRSWICFPQWNIWNSFPSEKFYKMNHGRSI